MTRPIVKNTTAAAHTPRSHVVALAVMTLVTLAGLALGASAAAGAEVPASLPAAGAELLASTPAAGGAAVASACPCSGPAFGGIWRNHGQYLSCVTRTARREARTTELTAGDARQIVRDGARSTCGKSRPEQGNVRVCAKNPVLPCPTVRTARVDDCGECTAALAGRLVHCARVAGKSGATVDTCGDTSRARALGGRVIEQRTGVDCASCKAKLGTPAAEGLDCVVARCG